MGLLKKIIRFFFRFILGLICFILFYLCLAWLLPYIKTNTSFVPPANGVEIFVHSNGVHTDFILPVKNEQIKWNELLPYSDFEMVDDSYNYISMGWGDKGFYINTPTWADLKFSTAFKAAFGLSTTAMHVTYKHYRPKVDDMTKRIVISNEQYKLLIRYIGSTFQMKEGKPVMVIHPGYTYQDRFYEANGRYTMFRTCNVWTGDGLRFIGVKIGVWTPFQSSIIGQLE